MEELKNELGEWVETAEGYGQIMYIRPYFVEEYENNRLGRKNGEFISFIFVCKILCGFDGKIKKLKRIIIETSLSPIDKKGVKIVENIKLSQKEEYLKYLLFDDKNNICRQMFRDYKLDTIDFDFNEVQDKFYKFVSELNASFTYKEFAKLFKGYDFPFKLENLINYGASNKDSIMLRFDSNLYKTKDKEAIFEHVTIFFSKNLEK